MSKRTVVEWSPHDASLFAVGADNLRLFEVTTTSSDAAAAPTTQRKRAFRVVRINAKVSQLKCLQWHPFEAKPLLIATGTGSGKVLLCDFEDPRARVMREFLPKYSRPCHAVAWNPSVPNQLAAGFEKVRSDFCTLVWDLNTSGAAGGAGGTGGAGLTSSGSSGNIEGLVDQDGSRKGGSSNGGGSASVGVGAGGSGFSAADSKPVHELANSEATMALSWVPLQPTCLATGTGFKWLRVYDLRAKGSSPMSVVAHNKAVLGVVFDQHRPHMLATYSDAPQEPVKVWDIRQLESSSGPLFSLYQTSKNLAQVSWCPSKPGILVTASTEEKWVSLWDVTKQESGSSTLKKPFRRRYTSEPLTSFSWQHVDSPSRMQRATNVGKSVNAQKHQLTAAAFPNRLLTASITGELGDISVHDAMPLSLSSHGAVTFGCGRLLFGGSVSGPGLGTSAVTRLALEEEINSGARVEEDISNEMYKLAKKGYSIGLSKNLKLFSESTPRGRQLRNLWLWVDQVEALRRIRASRVEQSRATSNGLGNSAVNAVMAGPLRGWPVDPSTLVTAGVKNLLTSSGESSSTSKQGAPVLTATAQEDSREEEPAVTVVSVMKTDQVLGCQYFEGPGRRLGLLACNWDPDNGQGVRGPSAGVGGPGIDSASGRNIHRSSSSIWNPQKQYDENAHFANRSWNENGRHELQNILNRCELEGNYARAAALAVFHGDLNAAVALLQKGATWLTQMQHLNVGVSSPYSPDLLQLIAMSVAGYSSSIASTGGLSLWSNMTQQLLKRSEIMSQANPRYFHAMLSFLCAASSTSSSNTTNLNAIRASQQPPRRANSRRNWGSVDGLAAFGGARPASAGAYSAILNDITLPLSDRLAFACRYLQADELLEFVAQHEEESEQFGRLEGLIVTGINAGGIRLLQTYLDMTGDIQTLALLAARLPSSYVAKSSRMEKWIQIYKDLLNQWQLFHERARFDVGRSQLEDLLNGFATFSRDCDAEDLQAELSAPSTLSVPPQLFVRCNFCNASLSLASLLRLGGSHSSWLNRAKPKLTCCPTCRKPLPQCALCLLPFGSLNPYFELAHRRSRQTADAVNTLVSSVAADSGGVLKEPKTGKNEYENLGQLSSIPFVEWFTWCQSCKHGGHAHHLADWFKAHTVCPVTDCNCNCQHLDLPIVGDDDQAAIIEKQRASAAALATQRAAASKGKKKQQQQQYQQQKPQEAKPASRGGKKAFIDKQQQQVSMGSQGSQHSFSASSTIGTGSTYRSYSSAQLRPSGSAGGYPPPFSLSGSNSVANLSTGLAAVGAGNNVGGAVSDGISLGNKLDQLEKDKSSYQYM